MDKPLTDDELDALERWAKGSRGSRVSPLLLRLIPEVRRLREMLSRAEFELHNWVPWENKMLRQIRTLTGEDQ